MDKPAAKPIAVRQTADFSRWFAKLRDPSARARINARIRRLELGNLGDKKAVGQGLSELRIDHGPGYRIYFATIDARLVILLAGGDTSRQQADIVRVGSLLANHDER